MLCSMAFLWKFLALMWGWEVHVGIQTRVEVKLMGLLAVAHNAAGAELQRLNPAGGVITVVVQIALNSVSEGGYGAA